MTDLKTNDLTCEQVLAGARAVSSDRTQEMLSGMAVMAKKPGRPVDSGTKEQVVLLFESLVPNATTIEAMIAAVQNAAQQAIEQAEVIRLSLADQARLSPPQPSPALERAFSHRSKLLRTE